MCRRNEKGPSVESAVSFAPLRPAGFVNFTGRGGARTAFCGAGQPVFRGAGRVRGGATIPGLWLTMKRRKNSAMAFQNVLPNGKRSKGILNPEN